MGKCFILQLLDEDAEIEEEDLLDLLDTAVEEDLDDDDEEDLDDDDEVRVKS